MSEYSEIFQPLVDLFTQSQVNTILLAWLPAKFGAHMTGIMAVDMFLTSVIASGLSTCALALYTFLSTFALGNPWKKKGSVTVQVEYYTEGTYGDLYTSVFYEALSWLISQQTKNLGEGSFVVQHANSIHDDDDDECSPPSFNILPEKDQQITIEYKEKKFQVSFNMPEQENKDDKNSSSSRNKPKPSIFLTIIKESDTNVEAMNEFLSEVTRSYLETQKKMKVRSRYERNGSYWYHVQSLSSIRGLDTVALDESYEKLLKKELETFINDKEFYGRIGMPYRRGILLYGKPGTGKTSLINAISSQLSRDIYYLNLKTIMDDNELSAAFSSVPANQIIVLEDVDTQSKILHKRTRKESLFVTAIESTDKKDEVGPSTGPSFSKFSLSTFLGCLDGNILNEGIIIIMTTNHVEHLDPACIRPGRMDVHLDLAYCTHYQIRKMYKSIAENPEAEFPKDILEKIPEKLLPPCEVMMTMVLYRNEIDVIPEKVYELVSKYKNMKPEEIAKQMEEEARRIDESRRIEEEAAKSEKKEEAKDENKEKKEEVKGENKKEEAKDENKEKKEEVKDEIKIEANKEEKKEEIIIKKEEIKKEIIKSEKIDKEETTNEMTNSDSEKPYEEEDSDSSTDVEVEGGNEKIKSFKVMETPTITSQVTVTL
ncbi:P-loop containing nucleoside triphosphate hydrolase protein [Glomus cerebriforme]|uniref:P-loop containing nucleoside triphosphate hydrolase protein n=1 Tax=Glomus cerebriforme TaxID=658196 RepID=A0A397TC83_9GLOM|nr:P-loop containing nucleoside triphosphate hydrolase protein [Glomus cerebriforme]